MKFLSVVCSMLLVIFAGSLIQAPASVEPVAPVVAPQPAPVPDDDAGTPVIEIGRAVDGETARGRPVVGAVLGACKGGCKLVSAAIGHERRQARRASR